MAQTTTNTTDFSISEIKYDRVLNFDGRRYTIAFLNGKAGIVCSDCKPITDFIYDDVLNDDIDDDIGYELVWLYFRDEYNKYFSMRLNGKWGLLDKNGDVVIDFKYSSPVEEWGENFIIRLNRKCAGEEKSTYFIMDKNKNIHAELNFDSIYPHANFAIVEKDNRYGIIDKDLKFTVAVVFDYLMPARYENEYLCGCKSGRWGILDYKGNIIFGFMYEEVSVEKIDGKYIFKLMSGGKWSLFNFCKV